jgi:cyclase
LISDVATQVFMPFCVGGGVRTVQDFRKLLLAGADKVAVNTAAVESPDLLTDAARLFGVQCVVASVDFRHQAGHAMVFTHGGRVGTGMTVMDHVRRSVDAGAGEILLTSVDRDGTMSGYDLEVTHEVAAAVPVPVIASGGAGTLQHLADAVRQGGASAVAVGSLFHFTDQSPIKARAFMRVVGVHVRTEAA